MPMNIDTRQFSLRLVGLLCGCLRWWRPAMAPIAVPDFEIAGPDERTVWILAVAAVVSIVLFLSLVILLSKCGCCGKERRQEHVPYQGPTQGYHTQSSGPSMQRVSSVDPRYKTIRTKVRDDSWRASERSAPSPKSKKTRRQGKKITFVLLEEPKPERSNEVSKKTTVHSAASDDKAPKRDGSKKVSGSRYAVPVQQLSERAQKKMAESRAQLERDRQWRQLRRGGVTKGQLPDEQSGDKEKLAQTPTPKLMPKLPMAPKAAAIPATQMDHNWQIAARTVVAPSRPTSRSQTGPSRPAISARPRRGESPRSEQPPKARTDVTHTFYMRQKQLTDTGTIFVPPSQSLPLDTSVQSGAGSLGSEETPSDKRKKGKEKSGGSRSHRGDRSPKGQRRRETSGDEVRSVFVD